MKADIKCMLCTENQGTAPHELFYQGNTHLRDTCRKYNIFVMLCVKCHVPIVHANKSKYQLYFCKMLGINYRRLFDLLINSTIKRWNEKQTLYMEFVADSIAEYYQDNYDVNVEDLKK